MARTVGLFLGAETANWSLAQFTDAARLARSLGCTELAVKCADGSIVWYASQGGLSAVRAACLTGGLDMIPYLYSYGDKFGALSQEIAVCKELMQLRPDHAAMVDMEVEWDGHGDWAKVWKDAIEPVPNSILYLTTWANPAAQNWLDVIAAIRDCVNVWVPQEYDTSLVSDESQYPSGLHMQPALNLPESWPGPNDPVAAAKTAVGRGHDGVWLWEYGLAVSNENIVRQIAAVLGSSGAVASGNSGSEGTNAVITIDRDAQGNVIGAHDGTKHVGEGFANLILNKWESASIALPETYLPGGNASIAALGGTEIQTLVWSTTDGAHAYGGNPLRNAVMSLVTAWNTAQASAKSAQDANASLAAARNNLDAQLAATQQQIATLQQQLTTAQSAATPPADPNATAALKIIQALKALESQIA